MIRPTFALFTLTVAFASPATALASDKTLLSGYGGPGGGEQSLLGGKLLPAPRGDGSLRAQGPRGAPAVAAPGNAVAPSGPEGAPAGGSAQGGAARGQSPSGTATRATGAGRGDAPRSTGAGRGTATSGAAAARPAGAPPVPYPSANGAGALPVGGSDVRLLLLGLLALVLVGATTRRLSRRPGPGGLRSGAL